MLKTYMDVHPTSTSISIHCGDAALSAEAKVLRTDHSTVFSVVRIKAGGSEIVSLLLDDTEYAERLAAAINAMQVEHKAEDAIERGCAA